MDPFMVGGAITSGLGALGKIFAGAKQNKLANQINPFFQQYQKNPLAQENLGLQGGTNEAFSNLAAAEGQSKAGLLTNLGQAYRGAISEGDKAYESMAQKFQMDNQAKAALRQSGMQNIFGGIGDIGAGAMQFGMLREPMKYGNFLSKTGGSIG